MAVSVIDQNALQWHVISRGGFEGELAVEPTSPSGGFLGFSSAVRQMPGNLCTAPRIISLSPLSLATEVTDATLGASGLWLGTRTGAGGTATQA